MLWALGAFGLFYVGLLLLFWVGLALQPKPGNSEPCKLSVIVAARNEEHRLPKLLAALATQTYPDFEVVVADDRSSDGTFSLLQQWCEQNARFRAVRVQREDPALVGKKGALAAAIAQATGQWLMFTDADCIPGPHWLQEMHAHMGAGVDFLAGYAPLVNPATMQPRGLKNLERASIFAVTAGSFGIGWPLTCTARNMAYRRELYDRAGGYAGIGHIRSGDDDLMLQKLGPHLRRMGFVYAPRAAVPSPDSAGTQQMQVEVRRGSKWRHYTPGIKLMSLLVMLWFAVLAAATVAALAGLVSWQPVALAWAAKSMAEMLLLGGFLLRVRRLRLLAWYPVAALVYIPYFIVFGLWGTLGRYRWKGGASGC